MSEVNEEVQEIEAGVLVRPHRLGGLELVARDVQGTEVSVRLGLEQAAVLNGSLQAHITMLFQSFYAQMAAEAEEAQRLLNTNAQDLYVPPGTRR
jgi:hypothetical protein